MKLAGWVLTFLIVAYWTSMNAIVVLRQQALRTQDRYRAAVTEFLGNELMRERWLGIYRDNKKVGYTGYVFEKIFAEEGTEIHGRLESAMTTELLGKAIEVSLDGNFVLDGEMRPLSLRLDMLLAGVLPFSLRGEAQGEELRLVLRQGPLQLFAKSIPRRELFLSNGLVPSLPVSGFQVGDTYQVPCFDPLTMSHALAEVEVVSREIEEIDGLKTDVFRLESSFRGVTSESWVTPGGEVLRQKFGPPLEDLVVRREKRENAQRFFKK